MADAIVLTCALLVTVFVSAMIVTFCVAVIINVGRYTVCKLLGRDEL